MKSNMVGRALVLIWVLSAWSQLLQAQQATQRIVVQSDFPGLDIQAAVGWEDCSHTLAPVAVSLKITNNSAQVLEGRLYLRNPRNAETRLIGEVAVGPGGIRQVGTVAGLSGWEQCELSWEGSAGVLWARQLEVPDPATTYGALSSRRTLFVETGRRELAWPKLPEVLPDDRLAMKLSGLGDGPAVPRSSTFARGYPPTVSWVPPWQLPVHPGPLTILQTVLLSPTLSPDELSEVQYRALARWVAMGGAVMLAEESEQLFERLREVLPLPLRPVVAEGGLKIHGCGAGRIEQYPGAEFGETDSAVMLSIAESLYSRLPSPLFNTLGKKLVGLQHESPVRQLYRTGILSLCALYAAVSAIPLLMFRSRRRRVLFWTCGAVATGCLGSLIAGVAVNSSAGDLSMTTVSWIGADSLVQVAGVRANYVSRRESPLQLSGREPELRLVSPVAEDPFVEHRTYAAADLAVEGAVVAWPAFDLFREPTQREGVGSLLLPSSWWGSQRVIAVDWMPLEGRLEAVLEDVDVEFENNQELFLHLREFPATKLRIRLNSTLPFSLQDCRLGIRVWKRPESNLRDWRMMVSVEALPDLAGGTASAAAVDELEFSPKFREIDELEFDWDFADSVEYLQVPHGELEVWIEGRLVGSPLMQPEGDSFRESSPGEHWFYYRIPQENLPTSWRRMQEWKTPAENR